MGKRGRPRQSGKRKNGRLIKTGMAEGIRQANDNALARRGLFGTNGWDAIGRAYVVGLLGEGDEAKDRLEKGRRYCAAHFAIYSPKQYRCALDRSPVGGSDEVNSERDARLIEQRAWLDREWRRLTDMGCGPYFDQLVDPLRMYTDHDPVWLAHLIENALANKARLAAGRAAEPAPQGHWIVLLAALKGLDALEPFRATSGRSREERRAA